MAAVFELQDFFFLLSFIEHWLSGQGSEGDPTSLDSPIQFFIMGNHRPSGEQNTWLFGNQIICLYLQYLHYLYDVIFLPFHTSVITYKVFVFVLM